MANDGTVKGEVEVDQMELEQQMRLKMEPQMEEVKGLDHEEDEEEDEDEDEDEYVAAVASGDPFGLTGKGIHYKSFHWDGNNFELGDTVLLAPEDVTKRPSVALIKDIYSKYEGHLMITAQLFYRPEEAKNKTGGNLESTDIRDLFYSLHREVAPAERVMHKCVVHYIAPDKPVPSRKQQPGFVVQRVYDPIHRDIHNLTEIECANLSARAQN